MEVCKSTWCGVWCQMEVKLDRTSLTSNMQTVEEALHLLASVLKAGDERKGRPDESIVFFPAAYQDHSSVGVQVFHYRRIDKILPFCK